jgi:hypothetical protein
MDQENTSRFPVSQSRTVSDTGWIASEAQKIQRAHVEPLVAMVKDHRGVIQVMRLIA